MKAFGVSSFWFPFNLKLKTRNAKLPLISPTVLPPELHEATFPERLLVETRLGASYSNQRLAIIVADRNHQPTSSRQLIKQRLRHFRRSRSDNDRIIGRMLRPTDGSISNVKSDVVILEAV